MKNKQLIKYKNPVILKDIEGISIHIQAKQSLHLSPQPLLWQKNNR